MSKNSLTGFNDEQQRAAENAMDILNAADICFVMMLGLENTNSGGVLSNMNTAEAIEILAVGLRSARAADPIEIAKETRQ